jgi:hypothetical protein
MLRSRSRSTPVSPLALAALAVIGCADTVRPPHIGSDFQSVQRLAALMEPCGASFRVVTWEIDEQAEATYQ